MVENLAPSAAHANMGASTGMTGHPRAGKQPAPSNHRLPDCAYHLVPAAGIAVPVLQIAPETQVLLGSACAHAAGRSAGVTGRPKALG